MTIEELRRDHDIARGQAPSRVTPRLTRPRIAVVTPSFNQGRYIEETIRSVVSQDYANREYIVMDGGSSDGTVDLLRKYDREITRWVSAKDGGQSDALHRGFAGTGADVLGWINSDDSLAPGALSAIAAAFETGTADIVAGVVDVRGGDRLLYSHRTGLRQGSLRVADLLDLEGEWLTGRFFYQPEVYFSRAIYEAAGGSIDTTLHYSMDYDLWVRLAEAGARILPIDCRIANFRVHTDQKTSQISAFLPELTTHANAARTRHGLPSVFPAEPGTRQQRSLHVGMLNDYGFRYGAGRAHRRIAESLAASGVTVSAFAFREGLDDDAAGDFAEAEETFAALDVDVIIVGNLHGVFPEGVDLTRLAATAPVLLVTHDFFWLTGRCPYPMGCDAFLSRCPPACPTRSSYPVIPFERIPQSHQSKLDQLANPNVYLATNSDYLTHEATRFLSAQQFADSQHKVRRIHLGVTESCFEPFGDKADPLALGLAPDSFIVLTASSHVDDPRKGFRDVLEAVRLAGDSRLQVVAMGQASASERRPDVHYTGHLSDDEALAAWYRAADVYVSASADETFGQTFVEAAMCGCPSIGYDVGGVRETIVAERTGWLVPKSDVVGLAACLAALVDEAAAERRRRRARVHVYAASRFGAPTLLAGLNDWFRELVRDEHVRIATGVQFGGEREVPIRWIQARRATPRAGFAPPEGPFPQFGIAEVLHWLTQPAGTIALATPKRGRHLVTLRFGNIAADQRLTIRFNGQDLLRTSLVAKGWEERIEVDLALDLAQGTSELEILASAAVRDEGAGRDLHLAAFAARVAVTECAHGLVAVRRLVRLDDVWRDRDDLPVGAIIENDGTSFSAHLRLLAGFDRPEGPYPVQGVSRRLAWQVESAALVDFLSPCEGPGTLAIDLMLPCRQNLAISVAGETKRFADLPASTWHRPTRLIIHVPHLEGGWTRIRIETAATIVDDAGRSLRAALLDVAAGPVAFASAAIADGHYALGSPEVERSAHAS